MSPLPRTSLPGIPRYYATTMPFRRSAYGLIVESHEGRPTKIEGNPSHPSTLGASSSLVQASVLGLYDPDRSQSVTLKGAPKSWSDFVTAWGELAKAHAADGGAGLADPLRVLLLADAGAPGLRAPCPLPPGAVGDLRRRQRREPARGTAVRHGARRRSHAPARSSLGDSRPRRRPAAHRPGDDPSRARLRGRTACGRLGWHDEPALRG